MEKFRDIKNLRCRCLQLLMNEVSYVDVSTSQIFSWKRKKYILYPLYSNKLLLPLNLNSYLYSNLYTT